MSKCDIRACPMTGKEGAGSEVHRARPRFRLRRWCAFVLERHTRILRKLSYCDRAIAHSNCLDVSTWLSHLVIQVQDHP